MLHSTSGIRISTDSTVHLRSRVVLQIEGGSGRTYQSFLVGGHLCGVVVVPLEAELAHLSNRRFC